MLPILHGKKVAQAILGGDKEETEEGPAESNAEMGLDAATDDVMSAFKSGDTSALKEALKAFVEQCRGEE